MALTFLRENIIYARKYWTEQTDAAYETRWKREAEKLYIPSRPLKGKELEGVHLTMGWQWFLYTRKRWKIANTSTGRYYR